MTFQSQGHSQLEEARLQRKRENRTERPESYMIPWGCTTGSKLSHFALCHGVLLRVICGFNQHLNHRLFLSFCHSVSLSRQSVPIHVLPSPAEVFGDSAHAVWTDPPGLSEADWENDEKGLREARHHPHGSQLHELSAPLALSQPGICDWGHGSYAARIFVCGHIYWCSVTAEVQMPGYIVLELFIPKRECAFLYYF